MFQLRHRVTMNKKQDPMLSMRESLQILRYKQTKSEGVEKYCYCGRVSQSCLTLCSSMDCSMPDFPVHPHLQDKLLCFESVMPSNHLILCHSFLLLLSIFPSIRGFSNDSNQVAKMLELQPQHKSLQ